MCPIKVTGADTLRLSPAQQQWLDGLQAGNGLSSGLSRLTNVGVKPDLVPIVVSLSPGDGLARFLTVLATSSALKEESTGELMLMLSLGLEREALRSLLGSSPSDGDSDEIGFDLLMPVSDATATSLSTSPRTQTSGTSGVPCDKCKAPINRDYVQVVTPPHGMSLYHVSCALGALSRM